MASSYEPIGENVFRHPDKDLSDTWTIWETISGCGLVVAIYLLTVLRILPSFMKNRPPFVLRQTLLLYNIFQVAFSSYMVFLYIRYVFKNGVITSKCPKGKDLDDVITEIYPYFIAKHLDLLDTVFFVLRKKDNQITFLHLYHHSAMLLWTWFHLMHVPTDHFNVVGLLNSFVHVLMYAYYGMACLGPQYAKFVWWKKHLTKIQLVQFVLVVANLHYQQKLSPCPIPSFLHYYCLFSIITFFGLFMKFYFNSYSKKVKNNS